MLILPCSCVGDLKDFLEASRAPEPADDGDEEESGAYSNLYYANLHGRSNTLNMRQLVQFALHVSSGMRHLAINGVGLVFCTNI